MDVFTDIDIFRDLQEISRKQGVAVYILLDQALLSQFLDMCMDLKVHPEQEKVCVHAPSLPPISSNGRASTTYMGCSVGGRTRTPVQERQLRP